MQINNNNTPNLNFQALPVAKAVSHIGDKEVILYKLGMEDVSFANKMLSKINLKKMYPNLLSYDGFHHWNNIISGAVKRISSENVFLAVHNKRPCGIISFCQNKNEPEKLSLSRLATWPIKENCKVPNAGKMLMLTMFKFAEKNNSKEITLFPLRATPRQKSCTDFYEFLGFKNSNETHESRMYVMDNTNFCKKCAQIENFFTFKEIVTKKQVNLKKELSLTFGDTFYEKILKFFKSHFLSKQNSGNSR